MSVRKRIIKKKTMGNLRDLLNQLDLLAWDRINLIKSTKKLLVCRKGERTSVFDSIL